MRLTKLLLTGLALMAVSSCASILPKPAPADTIYRLSAVNNAVPQNTNAKIIRIDRPGAASIFQGYDIIVSPDGRRLAAASGARWSELVPDLIQHSFVDVLAARPGIVGIIPSSGARTDTRIHLTVKSFEARFDNGELSAPMAVVHYTATLANASNRELIGTYDVEKMVRSSDIRVSTIVEAMDKANQQALNELADWLETPNVRNKV